MLLGWITWIGMIALPCFAQVPLNCSLFNNGTGVVYYPYTMFSQPIQGSYNPMCTSGALGQVGNRQVLTSTATCSVQNMYELPLVLPNIPAQGSGPNGFFIKEANISCQGCSYCVCQNAAFLRGQEDGYCCGDSNGGPGCVCPRTNPLFCLGSGGSSQGNTCSTRGFAHTQDTFTSQGVAAASISRMLNKQIGFARTALFGYPVMSFQAGLAFIEEPADQWFCSNCPGFLRVPIIDQDAVQAKAPEIVYPIMFHDLRFGTIIFANPLLSPTAYYYLVPFLRTETVLISGLLTDLSDISNPPDIARGWRIINYDGSTVLTSSDGYSWTYTIQNIATAQALGFTTPQAAIGTVYYATQVVILVLGLKKSVEGLSVISQPLASQVQLQYFSYYSDALSSSVSTPLPGTSQMFMTDIMVVASSTECTKPFKGFYLKSMKLYYPEVRSGFISPLDACQMDSAFKLYCNGPVPFVYGSTPSGNGPYLQAVLSFTDGGKPAVPNPSDLLTPPSAPLFMTLIVSPDTNPGVFVTLGYGSGSNGKPGLLQSGWFFIGILTPSITYSVKICIAISSAQSAALNNQVTAGQIYCLSTDNPCNLLKLNPIGSATLVLLSPINPPELEIADCDTCTDCLCLSLTAERGTGNMCCPLGSIGVNCTLPVPGCYSPAVGVVCSGNGNPNATNNINSTGCVQDPTSGSFSCSCLPEYAPPFCEKKFEDLCGSPLCNNQGNCTLLPNLATYICNCNPGYAGVNCQYPIPQCFDRLGLVACSGHGFCDAPTPDDLEDMSSSGFGTPICICDRGWSGVICEQSLDVPCLQPATDSICGQRGICGYNTFCNRPFPAIRPSTICSNCSALLGPFSSYLLLSGQNIINNGSDSFFVGDVGLGLSPTHWVAGIVPGQNLRGNIIQSSTLIPDFTTAVNVIDALGCDVDLTSPFVSGTFRQGVYCFQGDPLTVTLQGSITFLGTPTDTFVFLIPHALVIQTGVVIGQNSSVDPNNIVFLSKSSVTIQNDVTLSGWIIATSTLSVNLLGEGEVSGHLATLTGLLQVASIQASIPSVLVLESACTGLANAIDVCNYTAPENGTSFCNSRLPLAKKLLETDLEFTNQVFTFGEIQCLTTNFTLLRGFAVTNWLQNYCMRTVQAFQLYFGNSGQSSGLLPCPGSMPPQNANSYVRVISFSTSTPYLAAESCFLVSGFRVDVSGFPNPSPSTMYEAVFDRERVGLTVSAGLDPKQALLDSCQILAKAKQSPFYGIDTSFSLCWLPSVPSVDSTIQDLNSYPNYIYPSDIFNPKAFQFWVAPTSSIPS